MTRILAHHGVTPSLGQDVFVADTAVVIGDVEIGARSSVWFGCVVRGDVFSIRIGSDCNVQDNTVIHVTTNRHATTIADRVTIGHRALLHGCTIESDTLIGMGAIVMDGAVVESEAMVGAGSLVPPGMIIPSGKLALGAPARVVRSLRREEIDDMRQSAQHYVELATGYVAAQGDPTL